MAFLKANQSKFNSSKVITVSIFLAQQITTKTDLRCFEKLGLVVQRDIKTKKTNKTTTIKQTTITTASLNYSRDVCASDGGLALLWHLVCGGAVHLDRQVDVRVVQVRREDHVRLGLTTSLLEIGEGGVCKKSE